MSEFESVADWVKASKFKLGPPQANSIRIRRLAGGGVLLTVGDGCAGAQDFTMSDRSRLTITFEGGFMQVVADHGANSAP